ncbi:SulP family inorganic anion transporter [Dongia rigui]|uniref:SulP family inorganic anion transporter n=1 Tax=Dongia rigui TaxID=940149 RepID=A0ABU5E381_9PROT|nr:SulP family inorganic anion transporter [Dongia rigui]MDY0873924.1 SulP family inorganic anion transporter [Dongia rigui]
MNTVHQPSFVELFTPKLVTVLREGYRAADFRADVIAGLTVAIVALPLSMAIAVASGVTPDRGLYTAIVGGFIISAMGGSRFQIGGPAGAFIVLVAATVTVHGVDGLLLAVLMSGIILLAVGLLRLGTFVKYIPYPVTIGFTAGIAVIIFASQVKDLFGLTLQGKEPGELIEKVPALIAAAPSFNVAAFALALLTIILIVGLRRYRPNWPGLLIAVGAASVGAALLGLPVETIGTRFGGIPSTLPLPALPPISYDRIVEMLPAALSFALLGSIESLLSAVVADSMTGRRHRSNCELVAQGVANIASALFGGICVTGTIARTATNVRAGARGPISGMLHAGFLLVFMLVAAPLASFIPLAALAGVLATVAWNMAEKHAFAALLKASRADALVLMSTFLVTIFSDLINGILTGFCLSALLMLHRMSQAVAVETHSRPLFAEDQADDASGTRERYEGLDRDILICRISGAFFFGAAASVGAAFDRIGAQPKAVIVDFAAVPILDSTAAATIEAFLKKAHKRGAHIVISAADASVRHTLKSFGVKRPMVRFAADRDAAVETARAAIAEEKA